MKIKVKLFDENCAITVNEKGDWFDLKTRCNVFMDKPQAGVQYQKDGYKYRDVNVSYGIVPLGVAMKLPAGYEANVVPRSSTYKKWNVIQANSFGEIDNAYCGSDDQWMFPAIALKDTKIPKYTRICQFKIVKNQPNIQFNFVHELEDKNRGGFGSTGD